MADWSTFVAAVSVLLVVLLVMARVSASVLNDAAVSTDESTVSPKQSADHSSPSQSTNHPPQRQATNHPPPSQSTDYSSPSQSTDYSPTENGHTEAVTFDEPAGHSAETEESAHEQSESVSSSEHDQLTVSTAALLANVTATQGLFAVLVIGLAWYTEIPAWAFGLAAVHVSAEAVGLGILVGSVFYGLNEAAVTIGRRYGLAPPTALRAALAPDTPTGWVVLFVVVLPIIAGFEELLFRGALIGVVHAGFDIPLWLLAIGSSVAFGLGHGAQGRLGILSTGLLGLGLAGVFMWTGSLLVVIVAHYVINAFEFAVHETELGG